MNIYDFSLVLHKSYILSFNHWTLPSVACLYLHSLNYFPLYFRYIDESH